jgi:5-methylcytosine-specific restriction endonuclease McrA
MPAGVRCPICGRPLSFHLTCLRSALIWIAHDQYDSPADPDMIRRLARMCYLCGTAKTEHAEHLVARAAGGPDTWANMGGACCRCNVAKGARPVKLNLEQQKRWDGQQAVFRAAWERVDPNVVSAELVRLVTADREDVDRLDADRLASALSSYIGFNILGEDVPFEATTLDDLIVLVFDHGALGVRF